MKSIKYLFIFILFVFTTTQAQEGSNWPPAIEGRWDMDFTMGKRTLPGWLEIRHSGVKTLVGRIMIIGGSARPISHILYKDGRFSFSIPPQWDNSDLYVQIGGMIKGDSLIGSMQNTNGNSYSWTAVRAPMLTRSKTPVWGTPITLFNGKDLTGWHTEGPNQWVAENGILKSPKSGSNLFTDGKYDDFKLHIEFKYPKGSNSGIYLRGRYEVQITDSKGMFPWDDQFSGVYGVLAPNEMVAKDPGEWQSFDITLIGRRVTIVANGVTVISDQVIPGITGGAIDSHEAEPGPLYFQGDHGPIEFRNIILTPSK